MPDAPLADRLAGDGSGRRRLIGDRTLWRLGVAADPIVGCLFADAVLANDSVGWMTRLGSLAVFSPLLYVLLPLLLGLAGVALAADRLGEHLQQIPNTALRPQRWPRTAWLLIAAGLVAAVIAGEAWIYGRWPDGWLDRAPLLPIAAVLFGGHIAATRWQSSVDVHHLFRDRKSTIYTLRWPRPIAIGLLRGLGVLLGVATCVSYAEVASGLASLPFVWQPATTALPISVAVATGGYAGLTSHRRRLPAGPRQTYRSAWWAAAIGIVLLAALVGLGPQSITVLTVVAAIAAISAGLIASRLRRDPVTPTLRDAWLFNCLLLETLVAIAVINDTFAYSRRRLTLLLLAIVGAAAVVLAVRIARSRTA